MADDETASGMPVLSAFDKLKLSSNSNNYNVNINRNNNSCSNVNSNILNNRSSSQIERAPILSAGVKVATAVGTAPVAVETSDAAISAPTESSKCEKSISLPLAQLECNNKTIMMFGSSDLNATLATTSNSNNFNSASVSGSVSVCGKKRASGSSSQYHTTSSNNEQQTIQILCKTADNNVAIHSSLAPTPLITSLTSALSKNKISSSPQPTSLAMVLPSNNDDTFSCQAPSSSSAPSLLSLNLAVQNKVKKIDSNETAMKMLKSGKCKTSVAASSASTNAAPPALVQLKPKSAPIICAPPSMVLSNHASIKFGNNGHCKKSNPKEKSNNFGFPKLPSMVPLSSMISSTINMDKNRQLSSSSSSSSSSMGDGSESSDNVEDRNNKKKRCSDRYDSSESSDSGVATSLSCTDSSTASSDASDPGSPYSPVLLGDDLQQKPNMPPQTILTSANGDSAKSPSTSAATPVQNVIKGSKQQKQQSQNKSISNIQQKQGKNQTPPPLKKISHHPWSWKAHNGVMENGGNVSEMASSPKTTNAGIQNTKTTSKRHSQSSISSSSDGSVAKKCRTTISSAIENGFSGNGVGIQSPQAGVSSKRMKMTAVEESQTKITGYFKSQMKAQIHQSGLKKDNMSQILPMSSISAPCSSSSATAVTTIASSSSSTISSNGIVSPCAPTDANLNKYFNMISSQSVSREDQERASHPAPVLSPLSPSLKKIERSKPTKIAQVAPNLRKTTALSGTNEKSPKKHVAIAPRTVDTKPKQEQSVPSPMKAPGPPQQQSAVLLTAIRIPQSNQPPQLVPTSPQQPVAVANMNNTKTQQNGTGVTGTVGVASKIPTGPSLYQIPMMPNLVQFPNLIATNVGQLTTTRTNHSHATPTAQYFLNGTVFKLQQFTAPSTGNNPPTFSIENENQSVNTATITTTATSIEQHASNAKNASSITATSFQEMLSNQFQTQQQPVPAHNHRLHPSQPVFMTTTAGLLLNAASLPAMLSSNKQTMTIQSQQIPALQPIQGASAAVMPGLSSIFSSHQDVTPQQLQQYKSDQVGLEAQNTLQQTQLPPPLSVSSSAFGKLAIMKTGASFTPSIHQVSATQPPPLVTISSGTQNIVGVKAANGSKSSVITKSYQKQRIGQQENNVSTKHKQCIVENASKKALSEPVPATILITSPPPSSKSPPALAYPTIVAKKGEAKTVEDVFDLLKNSEKEINPNTNSPSPPTICQLAEKNEVDCPVGEFESSTSSSSPTSTEIDNNSTQTISDEGIKLDESSAQSPNISTLEDSLNSTIQVSSESPSIVIDSKEAETTEKSDTITTPSTANVSETSCSNSLAITLLPTVDTTLAGSENLPKSAISPILSQPKTIRFPAKHDKGHRFGPKGMRRHDGVCYWDKCNKKHESNSKLLDHMQTWHANTQTGPFACLWLGCKVYGRESCSRRWLERHVLSHIDTKPFKCIVEGCGFRFGSQLALQKHVNGHFTATENKDSTSKRTSDPPVPKLLRKNGKKLRYRRQPFSARMFDFFDAGIMEGLQHRLRQISTLTNGNNGITFQGEILMRRKSSKGVSECYVQWSPSNIISNEWLTESDKPYLKTIPINRMKPHEKANIELLLKSAYRLPYSQHLFQSFHSLSRQSSQDSSSSYSQSISTSDDLTDETSRSSSSGNSSVGSSNSLPVKLPQMELRKKQSRKPPKRIQPT